MTAENTTEPMCECGCTTAADCAEGHLALPQECIRESTDTKSPAGREASGADATQSPAPTLGSQDQSATPAGVRSTTIPPGRVLVIDHIPASRVGRLALAVAAICADKVVMTPKAAKEVEQ